MDFKDLYRKYQEAFGRKVTITDNFFYVWEEIPDSDDMFISDAAVAHPLAFRAMITDIYLTRYKGLMFALSFRHKEYERLSALYLRVGAKKLHHASDEFMYFYIERKDILCNFAQNGRI